MQHQDYTLSFPDFNFLNESVVICNLILESLKGATKLYVTTGKISQDDFNKLIEADPTRQKKYLEKLSKFYLEVRDIDKLKELVLIYDRLVSKKLIDKRDINQFKDFQEFKDLVEQLSGEKSKREVKELVKSKDVDIILNNDKFLIVRPKSHAASCIYGAGTKWCTTERSDKHWKRYYEENLVTFYYILNKQLDQSNDLYKIAVAVYPDENRKEVYDAKDNWINFSIVTGLGLKEGLFKTAVSIERKMESWVDGTYTILGDGSVDVEGDVDVSYDKLTELPLKFNKVSGSFKASYNKLTSLKGSPKKVGGSFDVSLNKLTSLEGSPKEVGGNFLIAHNELTSLEGAPKKVGRNFFVYDNELTSLKGAPKIIGRDFLASHNKLTSLKGAPKEIGRNFNINTNRLTSLKGAPKEIGRNFDVSYNTNKFTAEDVKKVTKVKGKINV